MVRFGAGGGCPGIGRADLPDHRLRARGSDTAADGRPAVRHSRPVTNRTVDGRPKQGTDGAAAPRDGEPAVAAECAWIGKRIVSLLVRDDAMAAGDFLPFYLRFHCPEERIGKSFGCVVRNGEATPERVELCWADPSIIIPKPPKEPSAEPSAAPAKPAAPGGN